MFKKFAFGSFIVVALAASAHAQESEDGWAVSFKRDAFDKTVFPEASIYEEGSPLSSKAKIGVACGPNGVLIPTFWASTAYLDEGSYQVEFKSGATQRKFTFTDGDIPRLGNQLRLQAEEATAFIDLFSNTVEPVAYRSEIKQGRFSSIAARQVFDIVRTSCPK